MASRQEQRRVNLLVSAFVLLFGGLMVFSWVMVALSEGLLVAKARLIADFRDAGSIGPNTEVQLAGKQIGKVLGVEFISSRYPCNPLTEDFGPVEHGRSDDCEPWMFCAPTGGEAGVCAELEQFSGHPSDYEGCQSQASCGAEEVCVTRAFRQRYPGVRWWGQAGWCVGFDADSQRIRVNMEIDESALAFIRSDSRAAIVLNGILADPRVDISVGVTGERMADGDRLQTKPSFVDELLGLKDEIDRIADEIDRGLLGVSALADSLSDPQTKADIAELRSNVAVIREQISGVEGLVGAVLNDPDSRADLSRTLRSVRDAALAAGDQYAELERSVKRTVRKIDRAADGVEAVMAAVDGDQSTALVTVLVDETHPARRDGARLVDGTQEAIGAAREAIAGIDAALVEITRALADREGSLGRLVADPKPLYHIKDPASLRRVNVVKRLIRYVIADDDDREPSSALAEGDSQDQATATATASE